MNLKTTNDMISIKLKFRPSIIIGKEGSLYYQVIYKRVIRQVLTEYKIFTDEWNSDKECLTLSTVDMKRYDYLSLIQQNIEWDNRRFQHIIQRLSSSNRQFNTDTVVQEFQNKNKPKRVPNIGKNAEPVPEIKIAPDPFPPIQIDATQSVEDSNPPFYDNTNTPSIPSDDVIASENSPSVPERSRESYSQSALLKQDVQVQPRKQTSPQVKRKKEECASL